MTVYFIDFEASSLSESSFPIEVAWGMSPEDVESYLIKPLPQWSDWSSESEAVHGISKETLLNSGRDVSFVCERMAKALNYQVVLSDAPTHDTFWRDRLLTTGHERFEFRIADLNTVLASILHDKGVKLVWDELKDLKRRVDTTRTERHRAAADVKYMMNLFAAALGYPQAAGGR